MEDRMIDWIDIEKKGQPAACLDCGLVMYRDDYEFGRYDGEEWQVYYENEWNSVSEPIRYYTRLNHPEPT
jgi:hypothetical protein